MMRSGADQESPLPVSQPDDDEHTTRAHFNEMAMTTTLPRRRDKTSGPQKTIDVGGSVRIFAFDLLISYSMPTMITVDHKRHI